MLLVSVNAQCDEQTTFKHLAVTGNLIPKLQNSTDTSVPGENLISDSAYEYQINYVNEPKEFNLAFFHQRLDYYSLRSFAFKHTFTGTLPPNATGSANGVMYSQGVAALYGQRYLINKDGYQGFGFGWYAGYARHSGTKVQQCCYSVPTDDGTGSNPIAAGEVFYKYNLTSNLYVEPVITLVLNQQISSARFFVPALIVGGEF